MIRLLIFCVALSLVAAASPGAVIETGDVARFYRLYAASGAHPNAQELQRYIDTGSDGLRRLARERRVTGARIAASVQAHPAMYADARRCFTVLPQVRGALTRALTSLQSLYPQAAFRPISIVVGRGKPVGIADSSGVIIGLEALCAVRWMDPSVEGRFVHVISHEYAHVQQAVAEPAFYNNPNPTLLQDSLIEGAAEFTAELISGEPGEVHDAQMRAATRGQERAIETAFLRAVDSTDISKWIDNSTMTKQGDLGYWVGYRIVKSYYLHTANKRQALRAILQMQDAKAFLKRSTWHPGMVLQ